MSFKNPAYHEELLHWIWENRHFDYRRLTTAAEEHIHIHNPGLLNKSDGPDFTGAEITIGQLRWYGDVEIHWRATDWNAHAHHTDANFNNVILHVVFEETRESVRRKDKTSIPTLTLAPYLSAPLQTFLEQYRSRPQLPCAGQFSFISDEVFEQQLEKAHREYFEQKLSDILEFYDADLPPSKAWLKALTIALFDGLGISHNREPMRALARRLFNQSSGFNSRQQLRTEILELSGLNVPNYSPLNPGWKHKGCRPGNHPHPRILQAADIFWHISDLPFKHWMREDPEILWKDLINSIAVTPSLGYERASILFGTVFLPALYCLGNLFFSEQLKHNSWDLWLNHQVPLPKSLLKLFENTHLSSAIYAKKLGTIYQLRAYCRPRHCKDCKVFKSAISP